MNRIESLLEEKLWSVSRNNPLDKETANQIIDYLLARLSIYLQQPLTLTCDNWLDGDAFSSSFQGKITHLEPFRITFIGSLGMETIGEMFKPHTSANLYLFGEHHRLTAGQPNRSYIYLDYARGQDNIGQWISRGWDIDEFDEYEDIEENEFL